MCARRRVPEAGSGGGVRKVPESSGVCWCRFRRRVPEAGSGRLRGVPARAGVGSGGGFQRRVPEGSGEFRCVLV